MEITKYQLLYSNKLQKIFSYFGIIKFKLIRINIPNGVEYSTSFSGSYSINGIAQTYLNPKGYLGEFIYFSRNLIEVERKDIEKYLSKKWAINLN